MQNNPAQKRSRLPAFIALVVIAGALGAFSLFVGYNKALAPMVVLRDHSA